MGGVCSFTFMQILGSTLFQTIISRMFVQRIALNDRDWEREACLLSSIIKIMPPFGVRSRTLTALIEDLGSLGLVCMQPVIRSHMCKSHLALFTSLCGNLLLGNWFKKLLILRLLLLL